MKSKSVPALFEIVFGQIKHWLRTKSTEISNYIWVSDIAGRRNNENMKLFKKASNNQLIILKSFSSDLSIESINILSHDCMIPVLLQSPWVPRFQNIFMHNEVFFLNFLLRDFKEFKFLIL
jgi:hypothetical protein